MAHRLKDMNVMPSVIVTVIATILTGMAAVLYKHELHIAAIERHVEQLRIKDYVQHRDILRDRVTSIYTNVNTMEAMVAEEPAFMEKTADTALRLRNAQLAVARGRLENYVEENKHSARSD